MPHLCLVHGALGAAAQFDALVPLLHKDFHIHRFDFRGHAARPLGGQGFSTDGFCDDLTQALDAVGRQQVYLFGYSMGGYVAAAFARRYPDRVAKLFTLGTRFVWSPEIAAKENRMLDPVGIQAKIPRFAQALAVRHTALGFEGILQHTAAYLTALGESGGFARHAAEVMVPTRVAIGDRDTMAGLGDTIEIYQALPKGQLQVFPGTPHPFEKVDPKQLAAALTQFFLDQ